MATSTARLRKDEQPLPELFRGVMADLASGVAVVTAKGVDGRPLGLAVTSISSYSADPPSVVFCVACSSRTHAALLEAEAYAVHLLASDQEAVAREFAGKGDNKFASIDWRWNGNVPVIEDALALLCCRASAAFTHGDHSILVGEVTGGRCQGGEPLVYLRRRMDWQLTAAE